MSDGLKRFIRDVGWSFASLAISAGVMFFLRIFLARYFGAGNLGLYTLSFTFYSFGLTLAGFGIETCLTKYTAEKSGDFAYIKLLTTSGISISFVTGCFMGLILYIASPYIANYFFKIPELTLLLRIVSISYPFIALEKSALGFLNGLRRMKLYAFINILQNIFVIALTLIFALAGFDITYSIIGLVVPTILMSLISLLYIRINLVKPELNEYASAIKILLVFGLFVVLANGIGIIQTYADTTLLGYFMKDVDVGIYATAAVLIQAVRLPPAAITMITSPMISGFWGKGELSNIEFLINRSMKWAALYVVLITFIAGFLSRDLIKLFFGADYVSASLPFQILLAGSIFAVVQAAVGGALSNTAFVSIIYKFTAATLILDIILNIILIPHFGLVGAGIASSSTTIIYSFIQFYYMQRLIKIKFDWPWFVKLFSVMIAIITSTFLISRIFNLYMVVAIGLIILVIVMLKYFMAQEDRKFIWAFIHISG